FENDNTCVACKKGKQHRASCKTKPVSSIDQPLFRLHMDLFRPTFVKNLNKKSYCLVITDDYTRFTCVFFLATKDETSPILKTFITGLENQLSLKVKVIKSDNGTEFKNSDLNQFCGLKGIKREFSVPRTPQQNGIAERKNKTLIEAAITMLANSLLPIPFWAKAINTTCYVQNRVLVTKPLNKTLYELLHGRTPSIGFMRPFGCPMTILNTLDPLGKFQGKEVIEFGDSYKAPLKETDKGPASESSTKKKGRTVAITSEDMQKRRNDVKARTTLLLALLNKDQLRFSKYKTVKELWEAILNTFGGNEATKKTKKNQLKMQYGNFKAEGSETLEQTFNRLQAIMSHLEDDLDTMSLDDVYNHLKVYKPEIKTWFSFHHQTPAVEKEDITQIDEDDIEEIDIKWYMALLSMRADRFWKKTAKKITIQGSDVAAGFDKSKVVCFNYHKMGHFARECRAPKSQDRGKRESYKQGPKEEEPAPKALMAIDGIGWDWSYMANEEGNHALVADDEVSIEFALMAKSSSSLDEEVDKGKTWPKDNYAHKSMTPRAVLLKPGTTPIVVKKEKESLDNKLTGFKNASKDLDNLLRSQRSDKNKEGLGYNAVPPHPAQIYSPPKKDLSWTGLPEFVDDTVTDYSRPTPSIDASKCNKSEL
nr:putative ribonuclease H-like domain-containing protein [Tanacetum cinerariifolium]